MDWDIPNECLIFFLPIPGNQKSFNWNQGSQETEDLPEYFWFSSPVGRFWFTLCAVRPLSLYLKASLILKLNKFGLRVIMTPVPTGMATTLKLEKYTVLHKVEKNQFFVL